MARWLGAWSVIAAALAWPAVAHAGGFEFPDLGTIPIGRGAAFVARADSLDAWHYNPAGLAKQSGPTLLVSSNVVHLDSRFTRSGSGDRVLPPGNERVEVADPAIDPNTSAPWPTVRNGERFGPAPLFVFTWGEVAKRFGVRGLALSVGMSTASGFGAHQWPEDGGQRYVIGGGKFQFLSYGGGVAWRPNRYIAVGGNFLVGYFDADFTVATRQGAVGDALNEEYTSDNRAHVRVRDAFVPSASFGLLSHPIDALELGLAVRLPFQTRAVGSLGYTPGPDNGDARLASRARVDLRQSFPTVVRAGIRAIHPVFDVEVDVVWENWRSVQEIGVAFSNPDRDVDPSALLPASPYDDPNLLYLDALGDGTVYSPLVGSDVPLLFRDTFSVRLGSDVEVWPRHLTLRAGALWQSSAYPEDHRTLSVRFPFTRQLGVGGGVTWHAIRWLDVTAGYLHLFQPEVTVTRGIVQANAFREPGDSDRLGNIVNNGRYRARIDLFGLALQARFPARRRATP
jgi:long-subunit fatty acid transport protein